VKIPQTRSKAKKADKYNFGIKTRKNGPKLFFLVAPSHLSNPQINMR
jgi:hypothetical protein